MINDKFNRMKEKDLLKVALICSLVGVTVLYLLSENIEIKEKDIEKITLDDIDKNVKVEGIVKDLFENDKVMIMGIEQPQEIKVVLFKNKNESILINKGNNLEIIGKVEEYEGELEIIGHRVRVIG